MRVLALETSTQQGSVAVFDPATEIALQRIPNSDQRIAQSLAPTVKELLAEVGWAAREVELIAVTEGPGSFTGLRAGITFAKVLAYATGAEVIAVNTLRVLAAQADRKTPRVWTVSNAQRQQLFAALWDCSSSPEPLELKPTAILDRAAWLEQLVDGDVITGLGLKPLLDEAPTNVVISPEATWSPTAQTLAQLGLASYQACGGHNLWELVPQYYRKSAAEEKLEATRSS